MKMCTASLGRKRGALRPLLRTTVAHTIWKIQNTHKQDNVVINGRDVRRRHRETHGIEGSRHRPANEGMTKSIIVVVGNYLLLFTYTNKHEVFTNANYNSQQQSDHHLLQQGSSGPGGKA